MAAYGLAPKTAVDVDGIYEYAILNFGLEQAQGFCCKERHFRKLAFAKS